MLFKDKEGNEIDSETWAILIEDDIYRFVKRERLDKFLISTVWIGMYSDSTNYIFETIVFGQDGKIILQIERYKTLRQAQKGHRKIIRSLHKSIMLRDQALCE